MEKRKIVISSEAEGMLVGDYLRKVFPQMRESDFRRLFSCRDVKLDGRPVQGKKVLSAGQELVVFLPEHAASALRIVYEDDNVLLVNKPSGLSVEADGSGGLNLSELCRMYADESGMPAPQPCHRLDNRTSGLCLFAKNEKSMDILRESFRSRTIEKYYICLVRGMMKPPSAICKAFLVKDAQLGKVQISDRPLPDSRPIVTGYETLENGPVSRLRIHLITGRTHQIRAHLAALGHPVLGDDLYGDRCFNREQKARNLKLCAVSLKIRTNGLLPELDDREFVIDPPF